jgi:hypothetical protein
VQGAISRRNIFELALRGIPDIEIGIDAKPERDGVGGLLEPDEKGCGVPRAWRDLDRSAEAASSWSVVTEHPDA